MPWEGRRGARRQVLNSESGAVRVGDGGGEVGEGVGWVNCFVKTLGKVESPGPLACDFGAFHKGRQPPDPTGCGGSG